MSEPTDRDLDPREAEDRGFRVTLQRWERYKRTGIAVDHETVGQWIDDRIAGKALPWPNPGD